MITQLDHRRGLEKAVLVDDQLAMREGVNVALYQQQVRAALHGQEPASRDVDPVGVLEMLNGCTCSRLQLRAS